MAFLKVQSVITLQLNLVTRVNYDINQITYTEKVILNSVNNNRHHSRHVKTSMLYIMGFLVELLLGYVYKDSSLHIAVHIEINHIHICLLLLIPYTCPVMKKKVCFPASSLLEVEEEEDEGGSGSL